MSKSRIRWCILFLILSPLLPAQDAPRYDANWILGGRNTPGVQFVFEKDSLHINSVDKDMVLYLTNTTMSNANGELQFYTNGCYLANANHQVMENGDSVSLGTFQRYWCDDGGSPLSQGVLALPDPGDSSKYYLFCHSPIEGTYVEPYLFFGDTLGGWKDNIPRGLSMASIDMKANNGLGKVIEKNTVILNDTLSKGYLHATLHANGRDWWIIIPEFTSNCYYKLLLTAQGITLHDKQCLGIPWNPLDLAGQGGFSPNGETYVRISSGNILSILRFDRCSGHLYDILDLPLPIDSIPLGGAGMAISPNSRYLYTSVPQYVFQYDLEATDIETSKMLIAEYDGFQNPNPTGFDMLQLAPDGKIYMVAGGSNYNYHVINQPDLRGVACDLVQHGITFPNVNSSTIPNHPNYRLGPLANPCSVEMMALEELAVVFPQCYEDETGEIEIDVSGGLPPYRYQWSDGDTISSNRQGLLGGTYTLTVTDAQGWSAIHIVEIKRPDDIMVVDTGLVELTCHWSDDAKLDLEVTGGTGRLTYEWEDGSTEDFLEGLPGGEYSVTITDSLNCKSEHLFEIIRPDSLLIDSTSSAPDRNFNGVGTATVYPAGGIPFNVFNEDYYEYLWSWPPVWPRQTRQTASSLYSGMYTVTVTDSRGCTVVDSVLVEDDPPVGISTVKEGYELFLFPNPVKEVLQINTVLLRPSPLTIELIDVNGRISFFEEHPSGTTHQINMDLPVFSSGVYWVRLSFEEAMFYRKIIVIGE